MRLTLSFIILLLHACIFAQHNDFRFRKYSLEDGLPDRMIPEICQDQDGFIWIASSQGINRFDGSRFELFINDSSNDHYIAEKSIRGVFCDRQNNIWVTGSGLSRYDRVHNKFFTYQESKNDDSLFNAASYTAYEDSKGNIWVGHWSGASKLDPATGKFTNYRVNSNLFRTICEDKEGNIWFGSFLEGAFKLNDGKGELIHYAYDKRDNKSIGATHIKDILCDSTGTLWFATWGGGLNRYDAKKDQFIRYHLPDYEVLSNADNVDAIYIDKKNNFWVGTDRGLFLFDCDEGTFSPIRVVGKDQRIYADYVINDIFGDRADGIWVSTMDGILYFNLKEDHFKNYKLDIKNSRPNIFDGGHSNIIISEVNGVVVWNMKENTQKMIPNANIIFQDQKKRLWKQTAKHLIITQPYLPDKDLLVFKTDRNSNDALLSDQIINIGEDTSGRCWILYADTFALSIIDINKKSIRHSSIKKFLPKGWYRNDIKRLDIDADNNLWLFFWGMPVKYNITTDKVKDYVLSKYGAFPSYEMTYIDHKKNLWFISHFGIELHDKITDSFKIFSRKPGLFTGSVTGIFEDKNGIFWIPSELGVTSFNPITQEAHNYTVDDGLLSNKFNPSGFVAGNGDIILINDKCLTVFNPSKIKKNANVPPIVITHFRLFNKDVSIGSSSPLKENICVSKEIHLRYNQSVITFEFASLNYFHPEKNQYAYYLKGFEKEWNYVGTNNKANYTNLDPGEYIFCVKGTNNDGVWNENFTSIKIIISPPFWKTWWFRIILFLFIITVIIIIFQIRIRSIKRQKQILEKQVQERTAEVVAQAEELKILNSTKDKFFSIIGHDLKNPFYAINGLATILKEDAGSIPAGQRSEMISMIEESSRNASLLLENLLTWARSQSAKIDAKPESIRIVTIARECISLLQVNAEKKHITFVVDVSENAVALADKNMITTVIRNILNNALKFTPENGTIKVSGSQESGICYISIEDTGVGMDEKTIHKLFRIDQTITTKGTSGEGGTGLGLIICKEFIDKNNGKITVESQPGKGSKFIITLPAGENTGIKPENIRQEKSMDAAKELMQDAGLTKFEEKEVQNFLKSIKREDYTILLIEDNDEIRMNIKHNLNKYFTIEESADGRSGIDKAIEIIPDLIISDVMMPQADGFEVCSILKTDIRTSHIPIILVTSRVSDNSNITGINVGADDYIKKPVNTLLLIARIRNLIMQRKQLREIYSKDFKIKPADVIITNKEGDFLKQAIAIIEKNIDHSSYSVDDFSRDLGLSYIQIYRKLEALTNQSPILFIRSIRLKRAAQLLCESEMNVNEIAFAVGFNDASYFAKMFKEMFGVLPKQYALKNKRN